ncbi:MAG: crosslink repair DNA glycosylase YcaQ family protein [Anaerolineaceae bacterium]
MDTLTLTIPQARSLTLASLGLLTPPAQPATKSDLLAVIRRIHNLQIDTISVVARAHLHILWSRLGSFDPSWLDELHTEGALFEYLAHAACYLPIEDYPIYRSVMQQKFMGWKNIQAWGEQNQSTVNEILEYIQHNGAVKSADFKNGESRGGWWNWKVEKVALEYLYYRGDLMIARRQGFQRVYDLRERVLPNWDDTQLPSAADTLRAQVLMTVKALGIARTDWIAPYFYLPQKDTAAILPSLVDEGQLLPVSIEGLNGKTAFVHQENANLLAQALSDQLDATKTTLLSPFDPLLTDRARTDQLFGFDYHIECYTPAPKRKYGYFVLPILHRGRLVGRLDAKAWRKEKRLQVIKIFLESGEPLTDILLSDLAETLQAYAAWQNLQTAAIDWSDPAALAPALNTLLNNPAA